MNSLKHECLINIIFKRHSEPTLKETPHLHYKEELVNLVSFNNCCLFSESDKTHKYIVWETGRTYFVFKHIVVTVC
jgi:hypothetical protein